LDDRDGGSAGGVDAPRSTRCSATTKVALGAGVELPVLDAVLARIGGVEHRHADDDLAAVYELKLPPGRRR
jgi:hypothetical protein